MICIVALIVFAVLSIFSAKFRPWAKEAFKCIGRRVVLKPCETNFDEKMKSKITGKLMNKNPSLARFVYKHFEVISWIFLIILFVSLAFTVNGLYNLATQGSCEPGGHCILDIGACGCEEGVCSAMHTTPTITGGVTSEKCGEACECKEGTCR